MIGIIYETATGKIRSMIVPENDLEEWTLNGAGPRLLPDETFMLFGEEIEGFQGVVEMQGFLNNKLGL
jgi:hypothetical protein